jgi:transposase
LNSVYLQEAIRKAKFKDGKSNRRIANELGISRNTVKRVVTQPKVSVPVYTRTKPLTLPVMGPYLGIIETWLREDAKAPRKQQHTGKRIYDRLVEEYQFVGSYRRVLEVVAQYRQKPQEVFAPLAFKPGEMAQVDWIEDLRVVIAGKPCKVQVLNLVLNYSGGVYCEAFPHARQEAFFQGHRHAFEYWGGVPNTLTYDNLKSAVTKILEGHNRDENQRFVAFRSAYLFDSRFCNPARGNEKGRVENMVKFVQHNLFTPIPQVESFAELNQLLRQRCDAYLQKTQHGRRRRWALGWKPRNPISCRCRNSRQNAAGFFQ